MEYLLDEDILELQYILEVLREKNRNEINIRLQEYYILASLIGQAFVGKLPKEAPQLKDKNDNMKTVYKAEDLSTKARIWALSMKGGR